MKGSIVCRVLLCLLSLFRPDFVVAQVWDDFSDGDITNGVVWTGDTGAFAVNSGVLKLNSTGSDSSFLITQLTSFHDTMEWSVQVKLNFAPSSLNFLRIYLSADQPDLKSALNGYFLQFGETGSADAIIFCRQNSYQITTLFRSRDSIVAQPFELACKVVRFPGGQWELLTDPELDGSFFSEGVFPENSLPLSSYTGIKCVYTSTNATNFSFDNVYAGAFRKDTVPPILSGAYIAADSSLLVRYSEPMEPSTVLHPGNYSVNGAGIPQTVTPADASFTLFHLNFAGSLMALQSPELCVQMVTDIAGNMLSGTGCVPVFRFGTAATGDLLFSEVMYDPTNAPALPDAEYIEIYNRRGFSVLLDNWILGDPSISANILHDTLHPGEYRVYCDQSLAPLMEAAGVRNVKGLVGFPSLNNTGDHLTLQNANGQLIDALTYTPEMYRDPLRDDHGWSLERIDVDFPCHDFYNWKASEDPSGGSPGYENEARGDFQDTIAPWPVHAFPIDTLHLLLAFSEYPDTTAVDLFTMLKVAGYSGTIVGAQWDPVQPQVILEMSDPFQEAVMYSVQLDDGFTDCAGNPLSRWDHCDFRLPSDTGLKTIRLSEILFNPYPEGSDFLEVYNCGTEAVDLSRLRMAHADILTGLAQDVVPFSAVPRLLMPGQYAVAATDISDIRKRYVVNDLRTLMTADLPSFNDDEGIVVLLEPSLLETERFHYREVHHFPLITDPEGISLERISLQMPASDSTNWHSAAETSGFATPGSRNSQAVEAVSGTQWLYIEPVLFSPDNDGYHDVAQISIQPPRPGFVTHVKILNAQGIQVRELARQELMAASGTWIWDGNDDSGNRLGPGIYVILAELFHIDGETRKFKAVAVIAEKIEHGK